MSRVQVLLQVYLSGSKHSKGADDSQTLAPQFMACLCGLKY